MLDEIRATMPPIRDIVHTATVLDDALVVNLNAQRLKATSVGRALDVIECNAKLQMQLIG
jgi:hypothetical protein